MTRKATITVLSVLALMCFGISARADGLILKNATGNPVSYTVYDNMGKLLPKGSGCLASPYSIELHGPGYANRDFVMISGLMLQQSRMIGQCGGASIAYTPQQPPMRIIGQAPMTKTFTFINGKMAVQ